MSDKYAQFLPPGEAEDLKPKSPSEYARGIGQKWDDVKRNTRKTWDDFSNFTRSIWQNPHEMNVDWHRGNAERLKRGLGRGVRRMPHEMNVDWHRGNAERLKRGLGGHKMNWLELAKLSPEIRSLYGKMR